MWSNDIRVTGDWWFMQGIERLYYSIFMYTDICSIQYVYIYIITVLTVLIERVVAVRSVGGRIFGCGADRSWGPEFQADTGGSLFLPVKYDQQFTLPETNVAPRNWWLEY